MELFCVSLSLVFVAFGLFTFYSAFRGEKDGTNDAPRLFIHICSLFEQGTNNSVHVCRGAVEAMKADHFARKGFKPSG
jgi:hypothetical protein